MTQAPAFETSKFFLLTTTFTLFDTIPLFPKAFVEEPHNEDIQQLDMHHSHPYSSSRVCTTVIKPAEQPRV